MRETPLERALSRAIDVFGALLFTLILSATVSLFTAVLLHTLSLFFPLSP